MPGPPSFWYFSVGGRQGLTAILLGQSQQSPVFRPAAIKSLNDQCLDISKRLDRGGVHRQPEYGREFQAVIFVLDTIREVDAAGQCPDLRLDQMRRRGCAVESYPLTLIPKQGGLFLRAGNRNPEGVVAGEAEGCLAQSVRIFSMAAASTASPSILPVALGTSSSPAMN